MICPTHVNCCRHRHPHRAKGADRLQPKRHAAGCFHLHLEHTDTEAAGVQAGTTSFVSFKRNKVSPMLRPLGGKLRRKAGCGGSG